MRIDEVQGNMHFENSARATILANVSYSGVITISGKGKVRDGFLGIMTRFSGDGKPYLVIDKNNNNFVVSDFYFESSKGGYLLSGEADDPPGRVTLQNAQMNFYGHPEAKIFVLDDFAGNVYWATSKFNDSKIDMKFILKSNRKANIYLLGDTFYSSGLKILQQSPSVSLYALGISAFNIDVDLLSTVEDSLLPKDYRKLVPGLNDLQRMGQVDLQLNFPWITSLTLESVARHMYSSRAKFARDILQQTGQTFIAYLTERRLDEAKILLRESEWTTIAISEFVGFNSSTYFHRLFLKKIGMTPGEFRNKSRKTGKQPKIDTNRKPVRR